MKDQVELKISPDGKIEVMYQDGIEEFAEELGGEIRTSCRASNVEWEEIGEKKGWTVRSAYDTELAIRWRYQIPKESQKIEFVPSDWGISKQGQLVFFPTREEALKEEVKFFWELLAPKGKNDGNEAD